MMFVTKYLIKYNFFWDLWDFSDIIQVYEIFVSDLPLEKKQTYIINKCKKTLSVKTFIFCPLGCWFL